MPSRIEIFSLIIFLLAIIHTFLTPTLYSYSKKFDKKRLQNTKKSNRYHSLAEIFYLLSEVELVFGIWLLPLIIGFFLMNHFESVIQLLESPDYTSPLYMSVIVAIVHTRPIIALSERGLEWISKLGGDNAKSWWWTIQTIGPILTILLKEPGAMAISSILLAKTCFPFVKSKSFRYATLALLFLNISLGGLLVPFTSRSLYLVATIEEWDLSYTLLQFGWKAMAIIILNNFVYFFLFRKHFPKGTETVFTKEKKEKLPPLWIMCLNIAFLTAIVLSSDYAPLFLGIFFLFIGVHRATLYYQGPMYLKLAIFIGFFFASLLIHGELQSWWAKKFLQDLNFEQGLLVSTFLSALIDNAVVLYLLEQVRPEDPVLYAIVFGAISAGGLTLMANSPNLIGYNTLSSFFKGRISLLTLFLYGLPLTLISLFIFWIL